MLPMLTVQGAPGLTYLNGRLCGETGAVALPLARDGIQYLEVRPFGLETAGTALRLRLRGGCLCDGLPSGACAVQWPNGHIAIELRHEPPDRPETDGAPPALLDAWEGPDGRYLLVSEAGAASFGRSAAEAVFLPVPAPGQASLRPLAQRGWLAAEGACGAGRFAAVLQAQGEPALLACASGLSASVDGQGALHCMEAENDLVGHARARVWSPDAQGRYAPRQEEIVWQYGGPRWPQTPRETARAWLEALCLGASEEASGYLAHPERQEDLAARIGVPGAVVDLPAEGEDGVRLGALELVRENVAVVRPFAFALARRAGRQGPWLIESVEALPCVWAR